MKIDARGKQCPLPVIETKKALESAVPGEVIEVLVDNEIAVQNLSKMANHKGLESSFVKLAEREYQVCIKAAKAEDTASHVKAEKKEEEKTEGGTAQDLEKAEGSEETACYPDARKKGLVVVISSGEMGNGDDALGKLLMKGFLFALTQQDALPQTILFYNGGAKWTCEGSDALEDLKSMEAQGVEILTCGTCLNHYGLGDKLAVGGVTNMYEIAEKMTSAKLIVKP
ncbi:MAG: sulfurtransferase-like selenium metabolism protein YedF [bacterium]|nr:sulfurtransferase-like selenium metabolism protein YedF [bacterium]